MEDFFWQKWTFLKFANFWQLLKMAKLGISEVAKIANFKQDATIGIFWKHTGYTKIGNFQW